MEKFFQDAYNNQQALNIEYNCINCDDLVSLESIEIPPINFTADKESDSMQSFDETAECPGCGKEYNWDFTASHMNISGQTNELPEAHPVRVSYEYD